jgi:hypothetical protein
MATTTTNTATVPNTQATPAVATLPQGSISMPGVFAWFIGWAILLGVLYGLSKTRAGKTIVYYSLWLAVVLVVVAYGKAWNSIFVSAGIIPQGSITGGQASG